VTKRIREEQGIIIFSIEKETNIINSGHRIVSAVKRVQFVSDRM
jgi:hypothetical protein